MATFQGIAKVIAYTRQDVFNGQVEGAGYQPDEAIDKVTYALADYLKGYPSFDWSEFIQIATEPLDYTGE